MAPPHRAARGSWRSCSESERFCPSWKGVLAARHVRRCKSLRAYRRRRERYEPFRHGARTAKHCLSFEAVGLAEPAAGRCPCNAWRYRRFSRCIREGCPTSPGKGHLGVSPHWKPENGAARPARALNRDIFVPKWGKRDIHSHTRGRRRSTRQVNGDSRDPYPATETLPNPCPFLSASARRCPRCNEPREATTPRGSESSVVAQCLRAPNGMSGHGWHRSP